MRISFISGVFNILHPGHYRLFDYAKSISDKLIIGVTNDLENLNQNTKLVTIQKRVFNLNKYKNIDKVIVVKDILSTLKKIKPDYIIKGIEFQNKSNVEDEYIKIYGGKIIFSSGMEFSTNQNDENFDKNQTIFYDKNFKKRNKIDVNKCIKHLNSFKKLNICVLGEAIVDEYHFFDPVGMSREEASLVLKPKGVSKFIGGSAIVAAHGKSLGANVNLLTLISNDMNGSFLKRKLKKNGVNCKFFIDNNRQTITKKRFKTETMTHLRINEFSYSSIDKTLKKQIINSFKKIVNKIDCIIFSDFNYGFLPEDLVNEIILIAKKNKVLIVADSQISSQYGNILRFKNVDLICQTEHEVRYSINNNNDGLIKLMQKTNDIIGSKYFLLKLGSEGCILNEYYKNNKYHTERIDAFNKSPIDTSGAGDSMLITMAMSISSGLNVYESVFLASVASALQVSTLGNVPLNINHLKNILTN